MRSAVMANSSSPFGLLADVWQAVKLKLADIQVAVVNMVRIPLKADWVHDSTSGN